MNDREEAIESLKERIMDHVTSNYQTLEEKGPNSRECAKNLEPGAIESRLDDNHPDYVEMFDLAIGELFRERRLTRKTPRGLSLMYVPRIVSSEDPNQAI